MSSAPTCQQHPKTLMSALVKTEHEFRAAVPGLYKVHHVTFRCSESGCSNVAAGFAVSSQIADRAANRREIGDRLARANNGENVSLLSGPIGWCPDCKAGLIEVHVSRDPFKVPEYTAVQFGSNDEKCGGMCRPILAHLERAAPT